MYLEMLDAPLWTTGDFDGVRVAALDIDLMPLVKHLSCQNGDNWIKDESKTLCNTTAKGLLALAVTGGSTLTS